MRAYAPHKHRHSTQQTLRFVDEGAIHLLHHDRRWHPFTPPLSPLTAPRTLAKGARFLV